MYGMKKKLISTKSTIFLWKNLEMIENVFFIDIKKNILKHFAKNFFSVFGGFTCESYNSKKKMSLKKNSEWFS